MYSRAILLERIQLALLRGAFVAGALFAAVVVWHTVLSRQDVVPWTVYIGPSIIVGLLAVVVMWRTPAKDPSSPVAGTILGIVKGVAVITVVALAVSFFNRQDSYSRGTFLVFVPAAAVGLYLAAMLHVALVRSINGNSAASRRVVVVGHGTHARRIAQTLMRQPTYYNVVGILSEGDAIDASWIDFTYLGTPSELDTVLATHNIDVAMIALPDDGDAASQELIGVCMGHGVDWQVLPPMLGLMLDRITFEYVDGLPLVGERRSRLVGYNWYVKRVFDIVVAGTALVLLSPILLIAWILVRFTSSGPAVFRQQRVGLHGDPFTLYKFRTMRIDTSPDQHQSATANWILGQPIDGAPSDVGKAEVVHKITDDPRITSVGRFLRATSIDELPQLWNVIRGDMSLVGPRPPIAYEVARYTERHKRRLDVPPGVTGLWQVSGRNKLSFDEMVDLDLNYIETWSLTLDIEILLKTIPAVVSDHGY